MQLVFDPVNRTYVYAQGRPSPAEKAAKQALEAASAPAPEPAPPPAETVYRQGMTYSADAAPPPPPESVVGSVVDEVV